MWGKLGTIDGRDGGTWSDEGRERREGGAREGGARERKENGGSGSWVEKR